MIKNIKFNFNYVMTPHRGKTARHQQTHFSLTMIDIITTQNSGLYQSFPTPTVSNLSCPKSY